MSFLRRVLSNAIVQMVIEITVLLAITFPIGIIVLAVHLPSAFNEVVAELLTALLTFGVYLLASKYLERRPLAEMGLPRLHAMRDLLLGFTIGACLMSIIIGILALAGWYHITSIEPVGNVPTMILEGLIVFFCAAVFEEVLFRGIAFRLLEQGLGSWIALGLSALFFGASHFANPHATLIGAVAVVLTGGLLAATVFMLTRSLWPVIGLHWAWNYFEGPVFGAQVSGRSLPPILHSTITGPALWTGGTFGPEAGLVVVIVGLSVGVPLLAFAVHRGCIITPRFLRRTPHSTQPQSISSSI
ncbi:MAG: CPBP family intramembrane metalloprotease [Chloroflexota bacterium]|nr:CPBP family intramembrane metalloprotease [Chloroflexota bacterium]